MKKMVFKGQVRPVAASDLRCLADMIAQLAEHHGDVATVQAEALARDVLGPHPWVRVFIAEEAEQILGYVALVPLAQMQFAARGMDMHHLFVMPYARGQGVGTTLIRASKQFARGEGCHFLSVGTHPDNHCAQDVYQAIGFNRQSPRGPQFRVDLNPLV